MSVEFPLVENVTLVDPTATTQYLEMLFGYVQWDDRIMGLRGIGEKGTAQEGVFREPVWIAPEYQNASKAVAEAAVRWSQYHVATFIVPAVLAPDARTHHKAEEKHIAEFTTILADLDIGDIAAKAAFLAHHLGEPTMAVYSGGITDTGQPKQHLYWALTEPTHLVGVVGRSRLTIAQKIGDDASFGRITQIVRVPGSVHAKHGQARTVAIASYTRGREYDLGEFAERVEEMPMLPGVLSAAAPVLPGMSFGGSMGVSIDRPAMQFDGAPDRPPITQALTSDVHEGGVGEHTRWAEFSRVAGWHLRLAREGKITLADAANMTRTWMETKMLPPWPEQRFQTEFLGIYKHDLGAHGPYPESVAANHAPNPFELAAFAAWRAMPPGQAPAARFLVASDEGGWVFASKPMAFVADGGIGKTFMMLGLGLAVAAGPGSIWGPGVVTPEADGLSVVMFTAEDDRDELHARLDAIDPTGELRARAGDRFMPVPLLNAGGGFSAVETDQRGNPEPSRQWREWLGKLGRVPRLGLVIVDTFSSTMHGDENAANVINEWFKAVRDPICGQIGAALIATHHIVKASRDPISSPTMMRNAVRGSAAFLNNTRGVIGVWPEPGYKREMGMMRMDARPSTLYKMAIIKGNNAALSKDTVPLIRGPQGFLEYLRAPALLAKPKAVRGANAAWVMLAITEAAKAGYPFCRTGDRGLFSRRGELPLAISNHTRRVLDGIVNSLIADRRIVVEAKTKAIDVPGGMFSQGGQPLKDGVWNRPEWDRFLYDTVLDEIVAA